MSKEIKHKYTDEVICPYCGYEFSDSWEFGSDQVGLGLIQCDDCHKEFYGTRNVQITYSTREARYGTCKHCEKQDIVIEDFLSSYGKYKDLCVDCGRKEREMLWAKELIKMAKE